jgi:hypothetical protein
MAANESELLRVTTRRGNTCIVTATKIVCWYRDGTTSQIYFRDVTNVNPVRRGGSMWNQQFDVDIYTISGEPDIWSFSDERTRNRVLAAIRKAMTS